MADGGWGGGGANGMGKELRRASSTREPVHMLNISIPSKHFVVHKQKLPSVDDFL